VTNEKHPHVRGDELNSHCITLKQFTYLILPTLPFRGPCVDEHLQLV
jgi:hypothetical protein